MKDSFYTDDPAETDWDAAQGMRHSIRPRRTAVDDGESGDRELVARRGSDLAPTTPPGMAWDSLPVVQTAKRGRKSTAIPVVDLDRSATTVRAFDLLRTRLRHTAQEHGWKNIGVTAPTAGCGNTFTAVNLALSMSRLSGSRTVLMDFNLRNPQIARAFDMASAGPIRAYLFGAVPFEKQLIRVSDTLALGLNGEAENDSAEVLQDSRTWQTLDTMRAALAPELVIYDLPPMLDHDDVSAFLPQLDGVLLISDGTQTVARELLECERMLEGQVPLLGVVLNRARSD
jgi:Mrp family chromosome partitioning ATPase